MDLEPEYSEGVLGNKESAATDIPEGATCRICRGEYTEDNPLFHPCKCKGSIKYIHESCLMEWIASKNIDISKSGTVVHCDICHYPINFKTRYAENMPDRIPMSLLLKRSFISHFFRLKEILTIVLAGILFLVGVPLTWNFFGKLYTFILDRELPFQDDFLKSIIFGFMTTKKDESMDSRNVLLQMVLNYRFSILQILMVVVLHISLYFQYDMIVRENVFSKMVFHKIGPQYTKEELIKIQLKERFPMMDDETIENVAKIMRGREEIRNLQQQDNNDDSEEEENVNEQGENNNEHQVDDEPQPYATNEINRQELEEVSGESGSENETESENQENVEDDVDSNIEIQRPFDAIMNHRAQNEFDDLLDQRQAEVEHAVAEPDQNQEPEGVEAEEVAVDEPVARAVPADRAPQAQVFVDDQINDAADDPNQQAQQAPIIINLKLKLTNVIAYYVVAVVLIAVYLSVSYLLPTFTGFGLLKFYFGILKVLFSGIFYLFYLIHVPEFYENLHQKIPQLVVIDHFVREHILDTGIKFYKSYADNSTKSSIIIRSIPALVSYITTISLINMSSELICKGFSRENGMKNRTRRFIFQILFAVKCTFKVFTLFFIELAAFPVLTGLMLDFSLFCPLLKPEKFLWAPKICEDWPPSLFFVYWAIGTLYMYWFARYIGMIRKHIIRPGVLFFIRSPDDPNIKILHDSLIHPMSIQLSRLCLSMFIYAVFIIIGFGFHTRFLFPILMKSKLLTLQNSLINLAGPLNLKFTINPKWDIYIYPWPFYLAKQVIESTPSVNLYVRKYWTRVFDVSSRKLRLSSFLLNNDIPTERGYIMYRNWYYKLFASKKAQWSNPELYSSPKTASNAIQLFKQNRSIHAYFVPDGILMRVPSSDIISRAYVQTLFVPVTKDNKLLKPLDLRAIEERNKRNAGEFGYLDEQNTEYDGYTIVYTPPNFKFRYILLLVFVWLFASLLVLSATFASQITWTLIIATLITPAFILTYLVANVFPSGSSIYSEKYEIFCSSYFGLLKSHFRQLDIFYVCLGAIVLALLLERYHQRVMSRIKLEGHIIPVNIDGEEVEIQNNEDVPTEDHNNNPMESWIAIFHQIADREEIKASVFIAMMVVMVWINSLAVLLNLEQFYFIHGYFSHNTFKEYKGVFNGFWNPNTLQTNICFTLLSFHFIYTLILQYTANRNRPFGVLFKLLLKVAFKKLTFTLYTTLPIILSWIISSTLEFILHSQNYTAFWAPLVFLWRYRLKSDNDHIKWTFPQHLCYTSITVILVAFAMSHIVRFIKKWFGEATQNVKDEVYAKGRSLENFPSDEN